METLLLREAACACGDLSVTLRGEPVLVSSCCCTRCQRRTGSFFGVTVYFQPGQMTARRGPFATFHRPDGSTTFHFCPRCGSSLWWVPDEEDDVIGVAGGAFADASLPAPQRMVHTATRHPFVRAPDGLPQFEDGPDD
jgi:hypothetical protein